MLPADVKGLLFQWLKPVLAKDPPYYYCECGVCNARRALYHEVIYSAQTYLDLLPRELFYVLCWRWLFYNQTCTCRWGQSPTCLYILFPVLDVGMERVLGDLMNL